MPAATPVMQNSPLFCCRPDGGRLYCCDIKKTRPSAADTSVLPPGLFAIETLLGVRNIDPYGWAARNWGMVDLDLRESLPAPLRRCVGLVLTFTFASEQRLQSAPDRGRVGRFRHAIRAMVPQTGNELAPQLAVRPGVDSRLRRGSGNGCYPKKPAVSRPMMGPQGSRCRQAARHTRSRCLVDVDGNLEPLPHRV